MQWLCNHEDQNMQRMAVAIISILAAKVYYLLWFFFIANICIFLIVLSSSSTLSFIFAPSCPQSRQHSWERSCL